MQSPIELNTRTISYRADLNLMVVRWHTQAPLEVVQADYAQMLAAAQAYGTSDWLLDVRRRDKVRTELSDWCSGTFYPQAAAELAPRRLRVAVLNSPAISRLFNEDPEQKKYVTYALDHSRPFDMALFEDEGAAMQWLRPSLLR